MLAGVFTMLALLGAGSAPVAPTSARPAIVVLQAGGEGGVTASVTLRSASFVVTPVREGAPLLTLLHGPSVEPADPAAVASTWSPVPALVGVPVGLARRSAGTAPADPAARWLATQFQDRPGARPG